ncbi:MAG: UbiD family decarboxylase [Bradyrhizobiaceae bacterium]|nr:UbiD family decarboxylase [Hyphomicrobiales bacterium]MBV9429528.1 UbiD family decarboxylase [Bradyrhizobiaceae bacterium]
MSGQSYADLRDFIDQVERLGALRRIDGADPVCEIGGITEVAAGLPKCPALLFDAIKGHSRGFRVFTNATVSPQRAALALGIDPALEPLDALKEWKTRRTTLKMQAPVTAKHALFLENSRAGADADLTLFPAPLWHKQDGGSYIGSGSIVVMRDPDSGWINASIYRVQVHGRDRVTIQFDHEGRHGAIIARKYRERGKPCPIAVVNGPDPALFVAGFEYLPEGVCEYDFAGAIKRQPIEVVPGPVTGLPLPARAESVLEGTLLPITETSLPEGPFGEFTGYYAAEKRPAPVMQVEAMHWRNDPILLGSPPMKPPRFHFGLPLRAAGIWSNLENAGVTDVVGAWQHVAQLMTVIAVKQRYAGHSKRAGLIAAAQSYMGRVVVTVDDDVDPSDLADVMWAITTRCEPSESVDIVRNAWSSALDPRLTVEARTHGQTSHSKMIIDACKPFGWKDEFPQTSALSFDDARAIKDKWMPALRG